VKVCLPDALHARPANLLVRLAAQHEAVVRLRKGERCANAQKILDVLSLGAGKGEEIEIFAEGEGAEAAVAAIAELVARNFDGDLVPERGSGAVEGIAIGRALVVLAVERTTATETRGIDEERARMRAAEATAVAELDALIATLEPEERGLFEPERPILREVAAGALARVAGGGTAEEAVVALTEKAPTDLILDARSRLLEALADGGSTEDAIGRAASLGGEVILVAEVLTPSLVARMPAHVRGIVAVDEDLDAGAVRTSHAAILARGRELPLAMVPSHVALSIGEGDVVVVDTTEAGRPARIWVAPSDALVAEARARAQQRGDALAHGARSIGEVSRALGVSWLVNVGSLHDRVPQGVAGVGLLRTELLFAGRGSAPSEIDQIAALLAVGRAARGSVVTARLWDGGGDKPLAWLPCADPRVRGAELLFSHPNVLATQLAAIARASERTPIRALIPMTRGPADVETVRRALATHGAAGGAVKVGAMIETPEAARDTASIAQAADFVCVGTNDLSALALGVERSDAEQAFAPEVLRLVARVVEEAHAASPRKSVTVCGEIAADPRGARILVGLGADALSVAPPRLAGAVQSLAGVTLDACRGAARDALKENDPK
jgi:phosphotransferase system HPr (HPr) family protein